MPILPSAGGGGAGFAAPCRLLNQGYDAIQSAGGAPNGRIDLECAAHVVAKRRRHRCRALAPAREGFAESGLTDDELDALVEKAREDFFRETSEEGE